MLEVKEQYISEFEKLNGHEDAGGEKGIAGLRKRAMDRFESLGFPSTADELWRHTSLKSLTEVIKKYNRI